MNSKIIGIVLLFVFSVLHCELFAAEKWNVLLANWENLSSPKDKSIGIQIKKSITWQLQRNVNLNLIIDTNNAFFPQNLRDARNEALTNTADVIIYGNYYVEKEQIIIETEVYDILTNQIKMRKNFKGAATIDFFEVIDQMTKEISGKITELLPEISVKSEVEIKKQRETVFEMEKIKIKRMFYTRLGFMSEFGPKDSQSFDNSTTNSSSGSIPFTQMNFGLSIRYWDFRVDFLMAVLGMPSYNWNTGEFQVNNNLPAYFNISLVYYLPWINKSMALGLGFLNFSHIIRTDINKFGGIEYKQPENGGDLTCLSLNFLYNPFEFLEIGLMIGLKGAVTTDRNSLDQISGDTFNEKTLFRYLFLPVEISAMFFFDPSFGIESKFLYASSHYHREYLNVTTGTMNSFTDAHEQTMIFYIGMVYKVDLLDQ